jgi:hypothetical protein
MDFVRQVIAILDGKFPGEFAGKPGMQGHASGTEITLASHPGYAFIREPNSRPQPDPSRPLSHMLTLHETDDGLEFECWGTTTPDECVRRILPWAFPVEWTPPAPIDRAKEKLRLARLAEGLAARQRLACTIDDPDPDLLAHLTDEERQALDRDLASVNTARIRRHFPWDPTGRLALKTAVLLATYPTRPVGARTVSLVAVGPDRRGDEQAIRVKLTALFPVNQTHRWQDSPWMWQAAEPPELVGTEKPGQSETKEAASVRLLDEGKIEDALSLFEVTLSDDLHRLLGGQRILPPACCARADVSWTDLLVSTLRQSAPWLLAPAVAEEAGRIARLTGRKPSKGAPSWRLAIFPGQHHVRKASLMLAADRGGRDPRLVIEATGTDARLADTSWKRPIEVDFARYGIVGGAEPDAGS